jgi:hypothetical protein
MYISNTSCIARKNSGITEDVPLHAQHVCPIPVNPICLDCMNVGTAPDKHDKIGKPADWLKW